MLDPFYIFGKSCIKFDVSPLMGNSSPHFVKKELLLAKLVSFFYTCPHRRLLEKFSTVPYNIQEQDTERFMSLVDITLAVQMQVSEPGQKIILEKIAAKFAEAVRLQLSNKL